MTTLHRLFLLALAFTTSILTFAYDFSVEHEGQTFYFNSISTYNCKVAAGDKQYSGNVVIPSSITYKGRVYEVTSIEAEAFANCLDLTSVTIPNTVSIIRQYAFSGSSNLISVEIPNSVTYIGEGVFKDCI